MELAGRALGKSSPWCWVACCGWGSLFPPRQGLSARGSPGAPGHWEVPAALATPRQWVAGCWGWPGLLVCQEPGTTGQLGHCWDYGLTSLKATAPSGPRSSPGNWAGSASSLGSQCSGAPPRSQTAMAHHLRALALAGVSGVGGRGQEEDGCWLTSCPDRASCSAHCGLGCPQQVPRAQASC